MKKRLLIPLMCVSLLFNASPVFASYHAENEGAVQQIIAPSGDGLTRVSWGYGTLTHANPIGRKPWAYASSSTYAGTCNIIRARTKVESDGTTDYTSWAIGHDSSYVESATIVARTESGVVFIGQHEFQDTETSGWQYAETRATY